MGSSQSRFRPAPQDIWPRIKRTSKEPKLLPFVMQTMAHVKDPEGVSSIKVAEHLERMIESKAIMPRPRGLASLVRRALEHGVKRGYISRKRDKYVMALDRKGYAIYKNMQAKHPLNSHPKSRKVKTETRRVQKTARERQNTPKVQKTARERQNTPKVQKTARERQNTPRVQKTARERQNTPRVQKTARERQNTPRERQETRKLRTRASRKQRRRAKRTRKNNVRKRGNKANPPDVRCSSDHSE